MSFEKIDWPEHPKIYEINTWPWLQTLSKMYKYPITLNNIPEEIFDQDLRFFDAIWLMGVWERSPQGKEIARNHPDLQEEYLKVLADFSPDDVVGSPYSIYKYCVDSHLGSREGLQNFRLKLNERNIYLLLDYVPNHIALDHSWTSEKSDVLVQGTLEDMKILPNEFFSVGNRIYAHGRDPYFPPWTDTVQINAFSSEARQKAINTLNNIAKLCDGVRCDMAMLVTNNIFTRTWGDRVGSSPKKEFWKEVIPTVREKTPNFLFIAEVYWDMEWELQQQGFDFCYDKRLYDHMLHENAKVIRDHLHAEWDYQRKVLRFIENHDEPRAITAFGENHSRAAAIIALTLPGARLIHEGQMQGYKFKLPVQLGRRTIEDDNQNLRNFYQRLLNAAPGKELEKSKWSLCKVEPIKINNYTYSNLISYQWWNENNRKLIVVNFSANSAEAHIKINELNYNSYDWSFTDLLTQKIYKYKGKDLNEYGLYVNISAWNGHIFEIKKL